MTAARKSATIRAWLSTTTIAAGLIVSAPANADNWTNLQGSGFSTDTSISNQTNISQHQNIVKARGDLDITENHTVNIHSGNSSSIFAAWDVEGDATHILGKLNADGRVYVFNKNGVIFGANSVVDVGGIVASTGSLSDEDIALDDGKFQFNDVDTGGKIVLDGSISVADGGLAAFVAPQVVNNGLIVANKGTVALASGNKVTLDLYGDNLIEIAVDDKSTDGKIDNSGIISAGGGKVAMSVQTAKDAVDNVINTSGIVDVTSVEVKGGKIILSGGNSGKVKVKGQLKANGKTGGGEIKVKGKNIEVTETAKISADADAVGNGGRVDIIAQNGLVFDGLITARGGLLGGNGGFVDTSGLEWVDILGNVDASANNGLAGTWLIDPRDLEIVSGSNSNVTGFAPDGSGRICLFGSCIGSVSKLSATSITNALNNSSGGTNVLVTTVNSPNITGHDGTITIKADIIKTSGGAATLTMDAAGRIIQEAGKTISSTSDKLNVVMSAAKEVILNGTINTNGGDLSATANGQGLFSAGNVTHNGNINTSGGKVTFTANNDVDVNGNIKTGAGAVQLTANDDVVVKKEITTSGGKVDLNARLVTINNSGSVTTNGGSIGIKAEGGLSGGLILNGGLNAGNGEIVVSRRDNGIISVGDRNVLEQFFGNLFGDSLIVEQSELARMTADKLTIGETSNDQRVYIGNADLSAFDIANVKAEDAVRVYGTNKADNLDLSAKNDIEVKGSIAANRDVNFKNANVTVESQVSSANGDITADASVKNIIIKNSGKIVADTGDITLSQSGIFTGTANSVETKGSGATFILQNAGGKIQNAINAILNNGSGSNTVKVTAGNYAETVTVNKKLNLLGANQDKKAGVNPAARGAESEIKNGGIVVTAANVVIDGFKINQALNSGVDIQADNVTLRNTFIASSEKDGVKIGEFKNIEISQNRIEGSAWSGIDALGNETVSQLKINDNTIKSSSEDGIKLKKWNSALVEGNEIFDTKGHGINLELALNAKLLGNTISNAEKAGINLWYGNNGVIIQDNTISDAKYGIQLETANNSNTVIGFADGENPAVKANRISDVEVGIKATNASTLRIAGNEINGTNGNGVDLSGSDSAIVLANKIGTLGGAGNINGDGIYVSSSDSVKIAGNTIQNTKSPSDDIGNGIHLSGSNKAIIGGPDAVDANNISDIAWDGIKITGGADNTVENNIVSKVTRVGIYAGNTSGLTVHKNTVSSQLNGYGAIASDGGFNLTISENSISGSPHGISMNNATGTNSIKDNTISNIQDSGVYADNTLGLTVSNNVINEAKTGIAVKNSNGVMVRENTVDNTNGHGISVADSASSNVWNNKVGTNGVVDSINGDGINLRNADGSVIKSNQIANTKYNGPARTGSGITVLNSDNVTIGGTAAADANSISAAGSDGIVIRADGGTADNIKVIGNKVNGTARTGLYAENVTNSTIDGNKIENTGRYASIYATGGGNNWLINNDIDNSDEIGILVDSAGLSFNNVMNNKIDFTGKAKKTSDGMNSGDAVYVRNSSNAVIAQNKIGMNGGGVSGNGVAARSIYNSNVAANIVSNALGNGIEVSDNVDATVSDNVLYEIAGTAISAIGNESIKVLRNFVGFTDNGITSAAAGNIKGDGIRISDSDGVVIDENEIINVSNNGLQISGSDNVQVISNLITNSGARGLYASGANNGLITLVGNTFTNNKVGAEFESGNVSMLAANEFNGGEIGLRFAGSNVKLNGNSIGETVFDGQSRFFVELANGAFYAPGNPGIIDGQGATYNGFRPDTVPFLTVAQYNAIEGKLHHYIDDNTLGLFYYGFVPGIDQSDLFRDVAGFAAGARGLSITIRGLPLVPGAASVAQTFSASSLANISPAAGDDSDVANIEPAAGGDDASAEEAPVTTCWGGAVAGAVDGASVTYSMSPTMDGALADAASCEVSSL